MDVPGNCYADSFIELLQSNDLKIHKTGPTHSSGHTLDLIISRSETSFVSAVSMHDCLPPDHAAVVCKLLFDYPKKITKQVITRKLKNINMDKCHHDISCMSSSVLKDQSDVNTLATQLCTGLRGILDIHAPLVKREVILRPQNDSLREAKRERRRCERLMVKSNLQVCKDIYRAQCRKYNKLLSKAKINFYRDKIQSSNQHSLFKLVNKLSSPTGGTVLPSSDSPVQLANCFVEFFKQKITKLRDRLRLANCQNLSVDLHDQCHSKLHVFQEVNENDVSRIIKSSTSASCELDPLPTTLTKKCIDELLPVITAMVNASLNSGVMPCLFKRAIVTPLLKKVGASHEDLENYRPISNLNFFGKVIEKAATVQIVDYLTENNLHIPTQSAYKKQHSVETALTRVQNDIILSLDQR